jgi:hypothetical protein
VIAPTGYGKSHLVVKGLMARWSHVITLDVKGDDPVVAKGCGDLIHGFPTKKDILLAEMGEHNPRYLFRVNSSSKAGMQREFYDVFNKAWSTGGRRKKAGSWVLHIDEARITSDKLKMRDHLEWLWISGRSKGITMLASTQAPRFVPTEFYDQATWIAIGRQRDERTILRLKEIGGIGGDGIDLKTVLPGLERSANRREFLVVGPDDLAVITSWEPPRERR